VLIAEGLTKRYGDHLALADLHLQVAAGEICCLLGSNGAGKTTTITCFLGFTAPSSGRALVDGIEVARDPIAARRRLAYLPEQVALYPYLSGRDNLAYFCAIGGMYPSPTELDHLLVQAGLPRDAVTRRAGTYSKGMRQKVALAIALAKRAGALLLDEPTSGLDPAAAADLAAVLRRIADSGTAVLMATHDLHHAASCDARVVVLREGRMLHDSGGERLDAAMLERIYLERVRG
jgi:ABC-2 type transport system ATP-binding protein